MKIMNRISSLMSLALVFTLLVSGIVGCGKEGELVEEPSMIQPETKTKEEVIQTETKQPLPEDDGAIHLNFKPEFDVLDTNYTPIEMEPNVADYTINKDLSNIANLDQFPNLTAKQKHKLVENGFFVATSDEEQLFYIYEDNQYKKIPNFVTTDSVLQAYHIFYDYALRSVEGEALLANALKLNQNMLVQLQKEYNEISEPTIRAEALKALGYFGVAQLAFGEELPSDFPVEMKALVEEEMLFVNEALGIQLSPLFGYEIDYSLLTPRGHYTRSEDLTRYFKGICWYGIVSYPFYNIEGEEVTPNISAALRSIITTTALCSLPDQDGSTLWENIYSTTEFFVGASDDITPFQIAEIIVKVYGDMPDLNRLTDSDKLEAFYEEVEQLPKPQISANAEFDTQFRFMGQRYIPDSEILQKLSAPVVRPFPTGLDVFATLGSARAEEIIATLYKPTEDWPDYTEKFEDMKDKFTELPDSTWRSNMYYGWLWTQNSLTGEYGKGYPMFMQNTAWQDKSLTTALGSWAEMRHDTILYAKGSAAESGGDEPPKVYAYVEPNPEFYNRLLWLSTYSRKNLDARNVLPGSIKAVFERFEDLLKFLLDCSLKELRGEDLTEAEYRNLLYYGGRLENLTASCVENGYQWYQIESETDRNMAVIADVHTANPGGYLEEAVGTANEIYVVVPINGELYLTRGATFDYFEFVSQKRLTDEEWQEMVRSASPKRPSYTSSFIEGKAQEVPHPLGKYIAN